MMTGATGPQRWNWGRALIAGLFTGAAIGFAWSRITYDTIDFAFMNNHVLGGAAIFGFLFVLVSGLQRWFRSKRRR